MNPMSFITFFTVGELATMTLLAVAYRGATPLWHELVGARTVLFWLMLGGFVWVVGDLFQQYATKYVGISRGIPLSNTNQLWGLLWGILVFHELRGASQSVYAQVAGGSVLMALGAVAIALSSATEREHSSWQDAAQREGERYGVEGEYVRAGMEGRAMESGKEGARHRAINPNSRTLLDWLLILVTTGLFVVLAAMARLPQIDIALGWAVGLTVAMLALLATCGIALWRTTRFR
jgi:glucose uptake protein GlcU